MRFSWSRARTLSATALVASSITLGYAARQSRRLRLLDAQVTLPRLSEATPPLRLAYLTDFHVGGPGFASLITKAALKILQAWQPDLVLLGGDYFDQGRVIATDVFDTLTEFSHVYGVLGNHDYRQGKQNADRIIQFMSKRGVRILRNELITVSFENSGGTLTICEIVGLDDPYSGFAQPELLEQPPGQRVRLVLAHSPSLLDKLSPDCADLLLCGHTHWGQIRLSPSPYLSPLDAAWYLDYLRGKPHARWQRGWFWTKGTLVYVSAGIGTTQLPLRLFAPPEVVRITLSPNLNPSLERSCDDPYFWVRAEYSDGVTQRLPGSA